MSLYLDANVIISFLTPEALGKRAEQIIVGDTKLFVSDFCLAECASAISRRVRTNDLDLEDARALVALIEEWTRANANFIGVTGADIDMARRLLRRLDLPLRTPDAIHIATAQRLGARLATFDGQMLACARALGVALAEG